MASLVDPHHLPFGAIWEIFEQLNSWVEYTQIHPMQSVSNTSGYFVFDLKTDNKAVAYAKFDQANINNKTRLLDSTPLENLIQKQIDLIQIDQPIDQSILLSPFYAKSLLAHMLKAWGLPPKRYFPRKTKSGSLSVVSGVSAVYYFLNNGNAFQSDTSIDNEEDETDISEDITISHTGTHYTPEGWRIIDQGSGGFAIIRDDKPKKAIRVGDLVGIKLDGENNSWNIAVTRWLMVSKTVHKIGLQVIAETAKPVALRASNGKKADCLFKPAFLVSHNSDPNELSIIVEKGLYAAEREMEIKFDDKSELITSNTMFESTTSYEVFSYKTR
jgi:hypothetical protein